MASALKIAILIIPLFICCSCVTFSDDELCRTFVHGYVRPAPNEVSIASGCIGMPLNAFILIRKDKDYCALRFTRYWVQDGKRGKEKYATYEAYYQNDGTGDFLNSNAKLEKRQASRLPGKGIYYPLVWQPGKAYVECGNLKLGWSTWCDVCHVCFYLGVAQDDYRSELAPTPWTDIKDVNVQDPRVKWYKYGEERPEGINIPLDRLWEHPETKDVP